MVKIINSRAGLSVFEPQLWILLVYLSGTLRFPALLGLPAAIPMIIICYSEKVPTEISQSRSPLHRTGTSFHFHLFSPSWVVWRVNSFPRNNEWQTYGILSIRKACTALVSRDFIWIWSRLHIVLMWLLLVVGLQSLQRSNWYSKGQVPHYESDCQHELFGWTKSQMNSYSD